MKCICLQRFVVRLHALTLPTFVIFPVVLMGVVGKSIAKNDRITCTNADVGELLGHLGRCGIDDFHRIMGSATGGRLFGFEVYKLGVLALAFDREKLRGIGDDRAIHTPGIIGEYGGILRFQAYAEAIAIVSNRTLIRQQQGGRFKNLGHLEVARDFGFGAAPSDAITHAGGDVLGQNPLYFAGDEGVLNAV